MPRIKLTLAQCLILAVAAIVCACCSYDGYRSRTGECPPGEICSDLTPDGLFFYGSQYADRGFFSFNDLPPIAVGGTQTITVHTAGDNEPFDFLFSADLSDSDFAVLGTTPPELVLLAEHLGTALLRLLDPRNQELFDQVAIESRFIARYAIGPASEEGAPDDDWVLYAGATARIAGQLYDSSARRLVDETMLLIPADATTILTSAQESWDMLAIETTPDATVVEVVIRTGNGGEHMASVSFQSWIDEVSPLWGLVPTTLPENAFGFICFEARGGGRRVYSVPWRISVTNSATVTVPPSALNCCVLETGPAGDIVLTVEAANITLDYPITVLPASQ